MFMTHQAEEANESETDSKHAADRKPLGVSESVILPPESPFKMALPTDK